MHITIAAELTEQEQHDIRYLLTDALNEFMACRQGAYVDRRYAAQDEVFKVQKRAQVARRLALAAKLLTAAYDAKLIAQCAAPQGV
jgi:hypothetical protein